MNGQAVADWLTANVDPGKIYDHRQLHLLAQIGIDYDADAHMLTLPSGEFTLVPTYTPAELMKHPVIQPEGIQEFPDRVVLGFEIANAVHMLVWPAELPPGFPEYGWRASFEKNVASIAQRNGRPYRDDPPGGWWRERKQRTQWTRRYRSG